MDALTDAERSTLLRELELARVGFTPGAAQLADAATETSPACGDTIAVRVHDGGFSWEGHGCTVSMAAASALGGLSVAEFRATEDAYFAAVGGDGALPGNLEAFAGIGRFPLRGQCATLAWRAARRAVDG